LKLKTHADIIVPAVRGTTSVLHSALKHGSAVKRVVLTSSFVAVFELVTEPRVFTESNWNDAAMEGVKTKGSAADAFTIYSASKALAEKAACIREKQFC
jgi:nucleoside-diphosphate-sugar epimerase